MFSQMLPEVGGSRTWRKGKFKKYAEEGMCALFAYGLSQQAPEWRWEYSYGESANRESDCAVRCWLPAEMNRKEGWEYKPIQLKELPPESVSPHASLQEIIDGLQKYTAIPGSEYLAVAIFVNAGRTIKFRELKFPKLRVDQLWVFGFLDAETCFLVGNQSSQILRFRIPRLNPT
jgi:hypothetical protein